MITPNTQKLYLAPHVYIDHFIYLGQRYYLTADKALISDYGKYGMCPPAGRGFYLVISKKEFKEAKASYELQKINFNKAINGYLNRGVEKIQNTLF
jgi:hypothetical protein